MGICTVTELEAFRRCPWRWEFNSKNRLYLESASPLQSLNLGTLWHKGLDAYAQREMMDKPHIFVGENTNCDECGFSPYAHVPDPLAAHSMALIMKVQSHYREVAKREASSLELRPTYEAVELCKNMMKHYLQYYKGRMLPEDFIYIQPEQQLYKDIPNTEHCTCYNKPTCECGKSCRFKNTNYTHCKCSNCTCREFHVLEGTVDGLILHVPTKNIYILENKSFSVHTNVEELKRIPQFMGYSWIASDFAVKGVIYNGAWTRNEIPNGKSLKDLFSRYTLSWPQEILTEWANQAGISALQMFDPTYKPIRVVHPVGGCMGVNGCDFKKLCDARFNQDGYDRILQYDYRRRTA